MLLIFFFSVLEGGGYCFWQYVGWLCVWICVLTVGAIFYSVSGSVVCCIGC